MWTVAILIDDTSIHPPRTKTNRDSLPRNNQLRDAVFGQKLAMARPVGKEILDAAIGEGALQGKLLGSLDFYVVAGCDVTAAVCGLLALDAGVK
jgi:hypothetical protein